MADEGFQRFVLLNRLVRLSPDECRQIAGLYPEEEEKSGKCGKLDTDTAA